MKFSASMLKTFQECALQAKFSYLDQRPQQTGSAALFGSAVHEAIDMYHNGYTEEECVSYFIDFMNNNEPDYWNRRATLSGYLDQGMTMIREYIKSRQWSDTEVIASEFRFMVDIGEHQFSGIIDSLMLPNDHSALYIVDNKTGKRPILDALYLNIQFTGYHWASYQKEFWCGYPGQEDKYSGFENGEELWEYFKDIPREGYWLDLKKMEYIYVGPRGPLDFARMYRLMEQVSRAIELDACIPTIDESTCTWCPYQDVCPVYHPQTLVGDELDV